MFSVKTSVFLLADLQSYLWTKLAEMACLLLRVFMCVRQQRKVLGEVMVPQSIRVSVRSLFVGLLLCIASPSVLPG